MAKIIIENIRKQSGKVMFHAFIDGVKVGKIDQGDSLEIDHVTLGDHLLQVGFSAKKPQGVGVRFQLAENETKRFQADLTELSLVAAKWHVFLLYFGLVALFYVAIDFMLGFFGYQLVKGESYYDIAAVILPVVAIVYPLVELWRRIKPKNFIKIKTL